MNKNVSKRINDHDSLRSKLIKKARELNIMFYTSYSGCANNRTYYEGIAETNDKILDSNEQIRAKILAKKKLI